MVNGVPYFGLHPQLFCYTRKLITLKRSLIVWLPVKKNNNSKWNILSQFHRRIVFGITFLLLVWTRARVAHISDVK
jgi:hypothetical protein